MQEAPILIVDDDASIRDTVADVLDMEGYSTVTAVNGAHALSVMEGRRPRLVLLDMRMPVMDGWSFARAVAERGITVPILVMTAAQNAQTWAEEIDADGFVAKPFNVADLVAAVERLAA